MNAYIKHVAAENGILMDYSGAPVVDRPEYLQAFAEAIARHALERAGIEDPDMTIIMSYFKAK
jgi:hypothetical protein